MMATSTQPGLPVVAGHERHCFVMLSSGHTPAEIRWYRGWYDVVVKPAVTQAGYEPKLSAAEEQPSAINDEIRTHLAFDPMVVADLGGMTPDSDPNPNVMYELGIRHALGLPLVMMAWKGQRLPFDVGNQRVIMEGRELLDLETNRTKLAAFIQAAAAGNYYRPMDAVGRTAAIDVASATLGGDSLMGALVREIRDLRDTVLSTARLRQTKPFRASEPNVKKLLRGKTFRKELYPLFVQAGGTPKQWNQLLQSQLPPETAKQGSEWDAEHWKSFVVDQATQWKALAPNTPVAVPTCEAEPLAPSQEDPPVAGAESPSPSGTEAAPNAATQP